MNNTESSERIFRDTPVTKAILTLAVPTVISQIITIIYNMADTFFIGQLGDPAKVAAATLAMPLFTVMTAISNLFGVGGASLISRLLGSGERKKAAGTAAFCIWTGMLVSLLYGIIIVLICPYLLPLLGADESTLELATTYIFWTIGIGALPTVMNPELAHLIRADGHSREAGFGVALGGILNMLLDPIFIFLFRLDMTGAAIATFISNTVAMCYFLILIYRRRKTGVMTFDIRRYDCSVFFEVFITGLPSCLISLTATLSNMVLNRIIAGYSNEAVAGMGIAKRVNLLAFAVAQGITQGTLPLIGYNYTSGDRKRMQSVIRTLFILCLSVALMIFALLFLSAGEVTRLFINDAETVSYGKLFLQTICCACPLSSITFFSLTVFQATGKRFQPLILSVLRKGTVDVPFMLLFNSLAKINGVAWATPVAETVSAAVALILVLPYIKKLGLENGGTK